ncbi:hypothetical protein LDT72_004848 [Salmonella enterica]|nr:hypothetical protein [Salmonella enterica]
MTANFTLNKTLESMAIYASKAIAQQAARMPDVINLSFGEPEFGPPAFLQELIEREGLSWQAFMHSVKATNSRKARLNCARRSQTGINSAMDCASILSGK